MKAGFAWSRNSALPLTTGANLIGTFSFPTNAAFDPANARTYPWRFQIRLGQLDYFQRDWRTNFYVQDKWQTAKNLTLTLGVRHEYQDLTPSVKDAFSPRIGVAYDLTGNGKTLIRGGVGRFYNLTQLAVLTTLAQAAVISPAFVYDTTQVPSPATTGVVPTRTSACSPMGSAGLAVISPACRTFLTETRNAVNAGGFVNNAPTVDGNRGLPFLWSFSAGIKRELLQNLAVSIDYIGNRGRDQYTTIDINEGPRGRKWPDHAGSDRRCSIRTAS